MSSTRTTVVASRRARPAKAPLGREAIIDAALAVLQREGLEAMSLRRVAAELDTGAASLYVYVAGLDELRALVLDRALAAVRVPPPGGPWRPRLDALLASYTAVLHRHAGVAALAMTTIAAGPHYFRLVEALLGLLDEAGVEPGVAAWAVDLLTLYATATAAEHAQRGDGTSPLDALAASLDATPPAAYPRLHAVRGELLAGEPGERFTWAVDVLVRGLGTSKRPAKKAKPRARR
jgi:AcrR family transcriptional regulator